MFPLVTADGARLHGTLRGSGTTWVVLAHGFGGSTRRPSLVRVAAALAPVATVLSYDARGHGRSTGRTTLGLREALDVDAAVAAARAAGAERVVTVGFSMGGAAVLRQAGLRGLPVAGHRLDAPPDAVVSISATSGWTGSTRAVRRLEHLVLTRPGRLACRVALRTRVASGFDRGEPAPVDVVGRVAPLPLLLVHGTADHYFPVEAAHALAAAAPQAGLWVEDGMAHAEDGASPALLARLADHVASVCR